MLPEDLKKLEEKEPPRSREYYKLYTTTPLTLKEIATLKNITHSTIKYYSKTYKYKKRMEHYNIIKPLKSGERARGHTTKKKGSKKKNTKNKKQAKPENYTFYTYETTTNITLALTDQELRKLKKRSEKENYTHFDNYLINLLNNYFECIEANQTLGFPDRVEQLNKDKDHIIYYDLSNPKIIRCKNNIQDNNQRILEDYYKPITGGSK